MHMHTTKPFVMNRKTLFSECATTIEHGACIPAHKSWILDPLIANTILSKKQSLLFFPELPPIGAMQRARYPLLNHVQITQSIHTLLFTKTLTLSLEDISYSTHGHLKFRDLS
jgi:hypothetical protein